MSVDRYRFAEYGGWLLGVVGFGLVMFGIYQGVSGGPGLGALVRTGGFLVGGFGVSVLGGVIAMTSREHRGAGHLADQTSVERP